MSGTGGWTFTASRGAGRGRPDGNGPNPTDVTKLRALGFIGVMTRGMHHQTHHLMIASGENPHQ